MKILFYKVAGAIMNDKMTIYALGFGVGWIMCQLTDGLFDLALRDLCATVIFVWAINLGSRSGFWNRHS